MFYKEGIAMGTPEEEAAWLRLFSPPPLALGMELGALSISSKCYSTELYPQPPFLFYLKTMTFQVALAGLEFILQPR